MSMKKNIYHFDCRHFLGFKPCIHKRLCDGCEKYSPWSKKILIIKLGALGDVMRTTPVLHAFKAQDPNCYITWITRKNARPMLELSKLIDRLITVEEQDQSGMLRLLVEEFDEVHNYDKEDAATALAALAKAPKKFGFTMNGKGQVEPLNSLSEYSYDLGLSDELKFYKNESTYQEMTLQSSGLQFEKMYPYEFILADKDFQVAKQALLPLVTQAGEKSERKIPIIGLNTGSGRVFRTKQWPADSFSQLARLLATEIKAKIVLLGGKDEHPRNVALLEELSDEFGGDIIYPGCDFSVREFGAMLSQIDALVTGDTLAMHLSLAVGTPPVVIFGSTCHQEVDLYGIGEKLVGKPACAPCYRSECPLPGEQNMQCMKMIEPRDVFLALKKTMGAQSERFLALG